MSDSNIINQFHNAARNGDENTVRSLLLTSQVNINDKNKYGWTALINAAFDSNESMVSLLIDKGADINMKNNNGSTALMLAAINNRESMVSLLIAKGADINMKDNYVSIIVFRLLLTLLFIKNEF